MVLTLYCSTGSAPCRSVFMLMHKLNMTDVKQVEMNFQNKEQYHESYLKMNPEHCIPTLKDDDFIIWDSHAISIYLTTIYGKDDSLYPSDPKKRATINQRLFFDTEKLFPALRRVLTPIIYEGEKTYRKEYLDNIPKVYDFAEKLLTKLYFAGDELTLADICCASSISTLNIVLPIDKNIYPKLWSWLNRMSKEKFYKVGNEPGLNIVKRFLQMVMS